jgi:seryl-tRNA synthetase
MLSEKNISSRGLEQLVRRSDRLASQIESAVEAANDRVVKDKAARILERMEEWLDEINDLHRTGDEEVTEKFQSFLARLNLAEAKVATWPKSPSTGKGRARRNKLVAARRPTPARKPKRVFKAA